jgi:hypothetical protein
LVSGDEPSPWLRHEGVRQDGHRIGDGLRPMMNKTRRAANVDLEIRRSPKFADSKEPRDVVTTRHPGPICS